MNAPLEWMTFAPSPFAHREQITESCSLWDAFISIIAIFNVSINDVTVTFVNTQLVLSIKFPKQCIFQILYILKIKEWCHFVTYSCNSLHKLIMHTYISTFVFAYSFDFCSNDKKINFWELSEQDFIQADWLNARPASSITRLSWLSVVVLIVLILSPAFTPHSQQFCFPSLHPVWLFALVLFNCCQPVTYCDFTDTLSASHLSMFLLLLLFLMQQ